MTQRLLFLRSVHTCSMQNVNTHVVLHVYLNVYLHVDLSSE